jgi:hypothetical protein
MKQPGLGELQSSDLVDRFAGIAELQDRALLEGRYTKFNRLFRQMMEVVDELKSRDGDQRGELLRLYHHANMQVRLQAARLTLAVAPAEARTQLEAIAGSKWYPQAGDAGMCLSNLDSGFFKPS